MDDHCHLITVTFFLIFHKASDVEQENVVPPIVGIKFGSGAPRKKKFWRSLPKKSLARAPPPTTKFNEKSVPKSAVFPGWGEGEGFRSKSGQNRIGRELRITSRIFHKIVMSEMFM